MKTLLLLLITIIAPLSYADSISFGVYTTHFKTNDDFNNNNSLVAVEVKNYLFANFINSHGYETYLAGHNFSITRNVSIIAGASYGYDYRCLSFVDGPCTHETYTAGVLPMAAVKLSHKFGAIEPSIILADFVNVSIGINF